MSQPTDRTRIKRIKCPDCGAPAAETVTDSMSCTECEKDLIHIGSNNVKGGVGFERPTTDTVQVVIPAYNEAESIGEVVESIPDRVQGHEIVPLVVSDGSTDRTAGVALAKGVPVVEHIENFGQGAALRTGFEIAQNVGSDIIVTMDADGQHPVGQIEDIIEPVINDEADFVIGSRYLGDDNSGNGLTRRMGIRVFTLLLNGLTRSTITDCTNGFRAIRTSEVENLTLKENRFNAPEMIIEAKKGELRIREVPVIVEERQGGETKKPKLGYAVGLARTIVSAWMR